MCPNAVSCVLVTGPMHGWLQSSGPRAHGAAKRAEKKNKGREEEEGAKDKKDIALYSISSKAKNEYFIDRGTYERI